MPLILREWIKRNAANRHLEVPGQKLIPPFPSRLAPPSLLKRRTENIAKFKTDFGG